MISDFVNFGKVPCIFVTRLFENRIADKRRQS